MALSTARKKKSLTRSTSIILDIADHEWERVLIFPDTITAGADGRNHYERAEKFLKKLSSRNLHYLAKQLGVSVSTEARPDSIAGSLVNSGHREQLVRLITFAKGRGRLAAADEIFESAKTSAERKKAKGDFDLIPGHPNATLHSFCKLCVLVNKNAAKLESIYLHALWRSRATQAVFRSDAGLSDEICEGLLQSADELADKFASSSSYEARLFLSAEIAPHFTLFLFQREMQPRIHADYRNGKAVTHGFGWVLFGIDTSRGQLIFKGGGEDAAQYVKAWIEEHAKIQLLPEGIKPFEEYDFKDVSCKVLGDYSSDAGVDLLQLTLARCNRRSVSPVSIGPPLYGSTIREDLRFLREHDALALTSLADLREMKVRFDNHELKIEVNLDEMGFVFLQADDSGYPPQKLGQFFDAFELAFGLPLNCRIDLRTNALGHAPVLSWLLDITCPEQVGAFQKGTYEHLLKEGLLVAEEITECSCLNKHCKIQVVETAQSTDCPECHETLQTVSRVSIHRDSEVIYKTLQSFFRQNTSRKLHKAVTKQSKRGEVYRLEPSHSDDVPFEVLVAAESDPHLIRRCGLIQRPVLAVHTHGFHGYPYADEFGAVHMHLSDVIAATRDSESLANFAQQLEELFQQGQSRLAEIALRAGANAVSAIESKTDVYGDQDYEKHVFALLRSMFPFADRWGGGNKPDGFVSIPYFEGGNLRKGEKFNWSYDAKLTSKTKGYDLNKSEKRKAFEYVLALQKEPALQVQGNQLDAHVFVSNWITENAAKGVAEHFRMSHNSESLDYQIPIVVLRESFLVEFYKSFHKHRTEFQKRQPFIGKQLKQAFTNTFGNGYAILDKAQAERLVEKILKLPQANSPVDGKELRESLSAAGSERNR